MDLCIYNRTTSRITYYKYHFVVNVAAIKLAALSTGVCRV